jgi:PAS domain S-box-containing protein
MEESEVPANSLKSSGFVEQIVLDHIPYPAWLKDGLGRYLYVNEAFLTFYGVSRESVLRKTDEAIFPSDLAADYRSREQSLASRGGGIRSAEFAQVGGGRRIMVETTRTPVFDDNGQLLGISGIARGMDNLLGGNLPSLEVDPFKSEIQYRALFEQIAVGIFWTTANGRMLNVNPAAARILGYDSPEDLLSSVSDFDKQVYVSERRRKEYGELIETQGMVRDFEAQVYLKDRSTHWVSVNARSVADGSGNQLYCEGTIESITERKKLEAQLRNAQKMESIGTLAGGVAHDFNNILTTIMGYCSLIMMKAGKGNPLLGYIDQIMEAANRASTLTHSLLSFSRKQLTETKIIDVNETIKGVEKLLRRVIGEDVELRTILSTEKLVVIVGDGQIGQLLMNIATNARDAMPDGGTLTIKTELAHLGGDNIRTNVGPEGYSSPSRFRTREVVWTRERRIRFSTLFLPPRRSARERVLACP